MAGHFPLEEGIPLADMRYDPQWIVDTYGTTTAQDGDLLGSVGKMFAVGQRWKSQGSKNNWLDQNIQGSGVLRMLHTAGPNSKPIVYCDNSTNPGTWLHPNRDGNEPAATEADFHPSVFTYFCVMARDISSITGFVTGFGTRQLTGSRGFAVFFRESAGTRNFQFVFGNGTTFNSAAGGVWNHLATTYYIVAVQHDGTTGRLWIDKLFASPTASAVAAYAPRNTAPSTDHQNTFQLGQDGGQQTRSETRYADLLMYNRALNEEEFNSVMKHLSAKFAIAVT